MKNSLVAMMILLVAGLTVPNHSAAAGLMASYLYNLSDFNGAKPYNSARIIPDTLKSELYVLESDGLSVFNANGMEIYRIEYGPEVGRVSDLAVLPAGNLLLLVQREGKMVLLKADFRGEPTGEVSLRGLPEGFRNFSPNRVKIVDSTVYLLNTKEMLLVKADQDGRVEKAFDLATRLGFTEKERSENTISGFDISREGYIVVSEPIMARVHRISLIDDKVETFGKRGSAAGRFGVPSSVALDGSGNILVADALRSVVIVFDPTLQFITEFGGRGSSDSAMASPDSLAVDRKNRIYVSQKRSLGVTVFTLQGA